MPVFLFPLYLADRGAARPEFMVLPVVLAGVVSDYFVFFTLMMAICLLGLLPTVLSFCCGGRTSSAGWWRGAQGGTSTPMPLRGRIPAVIRFGLIGYGA